MAHPFNRKELFAIRLMVVWMNSRRFVLRSMPLPYLLYLIHLYRIPLSSAEFRIQSKQKFLQCQLVPFPWEKSVESNPRSGGIDVENVSGGPDRLLAA